MERLLYDDGESDEAFISLWRDMGWIGDTRPNAVGDTWRSTVWWINTRALGMMAGPNNHTRWKDKWVWHNRGCVLDKIASEWAWVEDCSKTRKRCDNGTSRIS